ncbi:TIGR04255 family protein [Gloeothece verrucosa]|uniref:TIGR04255 family protein n=1 Tax=Gloeothece verrucosa (strain PCC 7822) TaxID=497965 RepID=E0U9N8_GLOV7|nr:TIGR04255 family protein [Gloeothece verrucosa]ADN13839.1 conserved hypothetical protein [Gloeothece verrucosa PCC 7822]
MSKVKFTKPPLQQVAFAVEFQELVDFSSVHFGLYWETIKDRFPETFDEYPIFDENEESSLPPLRRVIFMSENTSKAIHLQNNGFAYNWKKTNQIQYSNFETLFEEFEQEWQLFREWWTNLNPNKLDYQLVQDLNYRIHYVNLIDQNSGWLDSNNYSDVFSFLSKKLNKNFKFPEVFQSKLSFKMPNDLGVLEVLIQQLTKIKSEDDENDENEVDIVLFILQASSEGIIEFDLETWFKSAHEYILECFLNLTQDTVQEKWGMYYE